MAEFSKRQYEFLRQQANQAFEKVRGTWIECGRWAYPHRIKWLLSQNPGERNNQHIVDHTHTLALRSYVAGFLEGNTSASRPWFRLYSENDELNDVPEIKAWLQHYTERCLYYLLKGNFYHAAGQFYYDYGVFNTGAYVMDEDKDGVFWHNLVPGSYKIINDEQGEAIMLILEYQMNVKALVDKYGTKKKNGDYDWSNFSDRTKNLYNQSMYTDMVDVVRIIKRNEEYDPNEPEAGLNGQWLSCTYEIGTISGVNYAMGAQEFGINNEETVDVDNLFLKKSSYKRKPFIVGKSPSNGNFEYGEEGPTLYALGAIKSLNKKAISKDQAIEQMLRPAIQGPAALRKSYITSAPNSFVPIDANSFAQGRGQALRSIFEINPQIGALLQDVTDLRAMVEKLYYSDYLMYLTQNPKTRTKAEVDAVIQEQQLVIGPNLQSLNKTHNQKVVEFIADWVLFEDPHLQPPPPGLERSFVQPEFISVFAQAQKAADLPAIDRYTAMIMNVGAVDPRMLQKANLDKLADLYEDRLYLPAGLNNPQAKVDAIREQQAKMAQRQQELQETLPAVAGAAKDIGSLQQKQ